MALPCLAGAHLPLANHLSLAQAKQSGVSSIGSGGQIFWHADIYGNAGYPLDWRKPNSKVQGGS